MDAGGRVGLSGDLGDCYSGERSGGVDEEDRRREGASLGLWKCG